jgi:hypothetical protein
MYFYKKNPLDRKQIPYFNEPEHGGTPKAMHADRRRIWVIAAATTIKAHQASSWKLGKQQEMDLQQAFY